MKLITSSDQGDFRCQHAVESSSYLLQTNAVWLEFLQNYLKLQRKYGTKTFAAYYGVVPLPGVNVRGRNKCGYVDTLWPRQMADIL